MRKILPRRSQSSIAATQMNSTTPTGFCPEAQGCANALPWELHIKRRSTPTGLCRAGVLGMGGTQPLWGSAGKWDDDPRVAPFPAQPWALGRSPVGASNDSIKPARQSRRYLKTGSRPASGGNRRRHTRSALFIGPPSAKPIMRVSDDDGFVRPRPGGSRLWEDVVNFGVRRLGAALDGRSRPAMRRASRRRIPHWPSNGINVKK